MFRKMRRELLETQLHQLHKSLGGGCRPVARKQLWDLYNAKDYTGIVKFVRDSMNLDIRIRVGLANVGNRSSAPAWIEMPFPMPPFGTSAFKETLATLFLSKSFLGEANFDQVILAVAHEMSHIVLNGMNHALRQEETAVDLTAMLLGYRDFYVGGCESIRVDKKWFSRAETHVYRRYGYLTPDEVRLADRLLVQRFGLSRLKGWYWIRMITLPFALIVLAGFAWWFSKTGEVALHNGHAGATVGRTPRLGRAVDPAGRPPTLSEL